MGSTTRTTEKTTSSPASRPCCRCATSSSTRTWSSRCSSAGEVHQGPRGGDAGLTSKILLVAQKSADVDDPAAKDLNLVGTLAVVLQLLSCRRHREGPRRGRARARIHRVPGDLRVFSARNGAAAGGLGRDREGDRGPDALGRRSLSTQYVKLNKKVPAEVASPRSPAIDEPTRLADTMAAHMSSSSTKRARAGMSTRARASAQPNGAHGGRERHPADGEADPLGA